MTERKIVIPDQMVEAATPSYFNDNSVIRSILSSALRWLSENPLRPTENMMNEAASSAYGSKYRGMFNPDLAARFVMEVQRRLFVEQQPEIPEDVKELLLENDPRGYTGWWVKKLGRGFTWNEAILEAYQRGRKSNG